MESKKGATTTELIVMIGSLIILVILTLVVVSTILGAGLFEDDTIRVNNEAGWINFTGYNLSQYEAALETRTSFTILGITNKSSNSSIVTANWTLTAGNLTNATAIPWDEVFINYTYVSTDTSFGVPAQSMAMNMTGGVDNVSEQLPTMLLLLAVVLILGVLLLLIQKSRAMGIDNLGGL